MINVTIGWINHDDTSSENNVPTLWIGRRNQTLGSKNNIQIIIIEGFDKLTDNYITSLEDTGYSIINGEPIYQKIGKKYSQLNRFGQYDKKCFLRWLVIDEIFNESPIIHYDGDIVFNETPEALHKALGCFTVVVQGCPAVVSIRDTSWMQIYKKNLDNFTNNIEKYSSNAWTLGIGQERSNFQKWAGLRSRSIISSDQDLIRHLIHTDLIPQDDPRQINNKNPNLIFIENPLFYFHYNMDLYPFVYKREKNIDYIGNKKIAYWHMQNFFTDYLKRIYFFYYLLKIPLKVDNSLEMSDNGIIINSYNQLAAKMFKKISSRYSRKDICKIFFENVDFSALFNEKIFWNIPKTNEELEMILNKFRKFS